MMGTRNAKSLSYLFYHDMVRDYSTETPQADQTFIETLESLEISSRNFKDRGTERWAVFNAASTLACKCTAAMYV